MAVGAELSTLQALHRTFQEKAAQALEIRDRVDGAIADTVWTGRFSDQFKSEWASYKANLVRLNEALEGAATDVRTNHNNIAAATGEPDRI